MTDRELLQMALDALEEMARHFSFSRLGESRLADTTARGKAHKAAEALRARLANEFNPDWDQIEALRESLREHMAEIQRLRARLAQPEPEPFEYWNAVEGWVKIDEVRQHFDTAGCGTIYKTAGEGRVPLYVAREWQGLTDEEIGEIADDEGYGYMDVARAIQAKLKEKNGF